MIYLVVYCDTKRTRPAALATGTQTSRLYPLLLLPLSCLCIFTRTGRQYDDDPARPDVSRIAEACHGSSGRRTFAYTLLLSPDFSKPDALAVIDVKPGSTTYSQIVHTVTMPNKGDEFHHFGWNACSSALSPLAGHAFLERRYLIIPGIRSSRIYIVDTKPDPTQAKIHKIIEPEEIFRKTGYSRPHTVHCGPEGIYVSTLGGGGKDGTDGPPGVFIMDCETFEVLGTMGDRSRSAEPAL